MTPLPAPRATLAGCMWLPRILEKARRLREESLPEEYASRFGAANGTDGQFLGFFALTKEEMLAQAALSMVQVSAWFLSLPGNGPERIAEWNELAVNLGREGFPMGERLPVALATTYAHLDPAGLETVFQVIEADEKIEGSEEA